MCHATSSGGQVTKFRHALEILSCVCLCVCVRKCSIHGVRTHAHTCFHKPTPNTVWHRHIFQNNLTFRQQIRISFTPTARTKMGSRVSAMYTPCVSNIRTQIYPKYTKHTPTHTCRGRYSVYMLVRAYGGSVYT